jgi:hypothetical protein
MPSRYADEIAELSAIQNDFEREYAFLALLSREVEKQTGARPIIVGGMAVEIYTFGGYVSEDIDLLGPYEVIDEILMDFGFEKLPDKRNYAHQKLSLYIEWQGHSLDRAQDDPSRVEEVAASEADAQNGLFIRVIGWEDIVIDRLCHYKWYGDRDSKRWAESILESFRSVKGENMDVGYLRDKAQRPNMDVLDVLESILSEKE